MQSEPIQSSSFPAFFRAVSGHSPANWQSELGIDAICRSRVIAIPRVLGTTKACIASWLFHRVLRSDNAWPRRLVWCLPAGAIVEPPEFEARSLVESLPMRLRPGMHVVNGGVDAAEWFLFPERSSILIGTQENLLSRCLNRGYAAPLARWPIEFGQLNQDALWIMEAAQRMGPGLTTSSQLQSFRDHDQVKSLRPCHTWWLTEGFQDYWSPSVDTQEFARMWIANPILAPNGDSPHEPQRHERKLKTITIRQDGGPALAALAMAEHSELPSGRFGRVTLVICNTFERACATYEALCATEPKPQIELLHGYFRAVERARWVSDFLNREACCPGADRVIVATSVVESGVDISASCVITELAPLVNLKSRTNCCAPYGGPGKVVVVDYRHTGHAVIPADDHDLEIAWETVRRYTEGSSLDAMLKESYSAESKRNDLRDPPSDDLLLRHEFDELFDVTAELGGAESNLEHFICSKEKEVLYVFWVDLAQDDTPSVAQKAQSGEICPVPLSLAREWLRGQKTENGETFRGSFGVRAWKWDWLEGSWHQVQPETLIAGQLVCVAADSGGYTVDRGFAPSCRTRVPTVAPKKLPQEAWSLAYADDSHDGDRFSIRDELETIGDHGNLAAESLKNITAEIGLSADLQKVLLICARWQDWGKSHPAFQSALRSSASRNASQNYSKSSLKGDHRDWKPRYEVNESDTRPGFRHELAGALGMIAILQQFSPEHPALLGPWKDLMDQLKIALPLPEVNLKSNSLVQQIVDLSADEFNLLIYLVASHHGKVRTTLQTTPADELYRDQDGRGQPVCGVREGDCLPSIQLGDPLDRTPEVRLSLEPASIGLSFRTGISWSDRCMGLKNRYGSTGLAYLESLVRTADIRSYRYPSGRAVGKSPEARA